MKVTCDRKVLERRPDAVLIDLDNTLYDYDRPHARALAEVKEKLVRSAGVSAARFDALYDEARKSVKADLGDAAAAHSRLLYFQRLVELAGLRSDVVVALDCEQTYWRTFLSAASLFPNVEDVLRLVRSIGAPIAVVTDLTAQIQFRKIVYFGLDRLIDHVVTSEEAGRDKPDAAIFAIAARKLALAPGAAVWMIGDHAVKDCDGAKRHLSAVTFLRRTKESGGANGSVDVIFDSFDELRPLFSAFAR